MYLYFKSCPDSTFQTVVYANNERTHFVVITTDPNMTEDSFKHQHLIDQLIGMNLADPTVVDPNTNKRVEDLDIPEFLEFVNNIHNNCAFMQVTIVHI